MSAASEVFDGEFQPTQDSDHRCLSDESEAVVCRVPRWRLGRFRFGPLESITLVVSMADPRCVGISRADGRPLNGLDTWCRSDVDAAINRIIRRIRLVRTTELMRRRRTTDFPSKAGRKSAPVNDPETLRRQRLLAEQIEVSQQIERLRRQRTTTTIVVKRDQQGEAVVSSEGCEALEPTTGAENASETTKTKTGIFRQEQEETRARIARLKAGAQDRSTTAADPQSRWYGD